MNPSDTLPAQTSQGPGRWLVNRPQGRPAECLLLLNHGAGGGLDGIDLVACAELLPADGVVVARFDQPWHVAGKKVATRPPTLDQAFLEALPVLLDTCEPGLPLISGGHSAGARVACRTADQIGARAVVALSFPLHPPGKPERSRREELVHPSCPVLVVQGERDPFGNGDEVRAALADPEGAKVDGTKVDGAKVEGIKVVDVEAAAHNLAVAAKVRPATAQRELLAGVVGEFLAEVIGNS